MCYFLDEEGDEGLLRALRGKGHTRAGWWSFWPPLLCRYLPDLHHSGLWSVYPLACLLGGAVLGPSETVIHRGPQTSWPGGGWTGARYFPVSVHNRETFLE